MTKHHLIDHQILNYFYIAIGKAQNIMMDVQFVSDLSQNTMLLFYRLGVNPP